MSKIETVGDLRLALEGIEDSMPILGCVQPREKARRGAESVFGEFVEIRVWEEGAVLYSEEVKR